MLTEFQKYEGAGNDFILIDARGGNFEEDPRLIARLCDRHFGIGADGLMTLSLDGGGMPLMHFFNSDGSQGEMCGNGARCFTLFLHHLGLCHGECRFRATDGEHRSEVLSSEGDSGEIRLGMIPVREITRGEGYLSLNTGVPHYVEFTDSLDKIDLIARGRAIRYDTSRFPEGTNVNFARIEGRGEVSMRTYERGVEDETLACGTGATAVAIATHHLHQPDVTSFSLRVRGGLLRVSFTPSEDHQTYTNIRLTGPARRVFGGTFNTKNF